MADLNSNARKARKRTAVCIGVRFLQAPRCHWTPEGQPFWGALAKKRNAHKVVVRLGPIGDMMQCREVRYGDFRYANCNEMVPAAKVKAAC